jgi:phosphate acetyltransferase
MGFADELCQRAQKLNKTIVLPETEDARTLQAADRLTREQIARVVLVGDPGPTFRAVKSCLRSTNRYPLFWPTSYINCARRRA